MSAPPEKAQVTNAVQQVLTLVNQKNINIAAYDGGDARVYIAGLLCANFNEGVFNINDVLETLKGNFGVITKPKRKPKRSPALLTGSIDNDAVPVNDRAGKKPETAVEEKDNNSNKNNNNHDDDDGDGGDDL